MAIEIEFEGENLEKALEKACKFFSADLDNINYKVISDVEMEDKDPKENKIKIVARRKLETASDQDADKSTAQKKQNRIPEFLQKIIHLTGLHLKMECQEDNNQLIINLNGQDKGLLIENRGQLLSSLQYILSKIFSINRGFPSKIIIDCNGYREFREKELQEIARKGASAAKRTGREYLLDHMNPYERRMIHITLKNDSSVVTRSRGEGFIKRVAIIPYRRGKNSEKKEAE